MDFIVNQNLKLDWMLVNCEGQYAERRRLVKWDNYLSYLQLAVL